MNKCFVSILFLLISISSIDGQRVLQPKLIEYDQKGVVFKSEKAFQYRLIESGMTIGYYQGEILSYDKTKFYNLELGFMRDTRERKQSKNYSLANPANSFTFGKLNSVINIRASIGRKRYLSEKAKRRGLAVGYSYEFGPSIALMKPYYLDLYYLDESGGFDFEVRSETYSEENADVFLDISRIRGASGYYNGLGEVAIIPGIQAKGSVHFALGAFDKYMKTFETGVMLDVFSKRLPILYETELNKNASVYVRLFAAIQFGVRKTTK